MIEALSEGFLKSAICDLTEVCRTSQGLEVSLPQAYSTGNVVAVVIASVPDGYLIHDNAYAAMLVERTGSARTAALVAEVAEGVANYGCILESMRVSRHCKSLDEVALSAVLVGCASRLVADQVLRAEKLPMFDFKAKLLGAVTELVGARRVRTNEQVTGHLGSKYKVSTVVLDASEKRPVAFLEPIGDPKVVPRRFKEFYDISRNPAYGSVERVSVLDDSKGVPAGDILLMQEVGRLVRFGDVRKVFETWDVLH